MVYYGTHFNFITKKNFNFNQIEIKFQIEMCAIISCVIPRTFIHHSFVRKGSWYTMAHISDSLRKRIQFHLI